MSIKNAHHIQVKGPVLIAMNHPNAFMDPTVFSMAIYPPRVRYLARGDAFVPGFISFFLDQMGIVPIYRIQDAGREGLKKNTETFRRVDELLARKKKIMVFAEGLCVMERRLRPLKKGVPRMVFGSMERMNIKDLIVVPVGANYSSPEKFRSTIFFNVGEPIKMIDLLDAYKENPAKAMNQFLHLLEPKMKELIVHINNKENDTLVEQIESVYKREWCKEESLNYKNGEHDYSITKKIVTAVNIADEQNKPLIDALKLNLATYTNELTNLKLRDWLINPSNSSYTTWLYLVFGLCILIIGLPLYIIGLIGNWLPYRLSYFIANKIAKDIEFHASFNISIGTFLFLFYYIAQFVITYTFSPNVGYPLLVIVISAFTGLFSLYYSPFRKKTMGLYRLLKLKNKPIFFTLINKRQEIMAQIQQLKAYI